MCGPFSCATVSAGQGIKKGLPEGSPLSFAMGGLFLTTHEHQQELEHVDEVQIQVQRTVNA